MKYKKSPLDRFLEQRINDNAKELKQTLNETLRMEQRSDSVWGQNFLF